MTTRATPPKTALLVLTACAGFSGESASAISAPEIRSVRCLTPRVARYERYEMGATIRGDWSNPFDPDQVEVSADFTSPGGKLLRVPGFWHQEYAERPPATPVRAQMDSVTLFAYDRDWPQGTKVDFFIDDVCLLDQNWREVPFDDMEQGAAPLDCTLRG